MSKSATAIAHPNIALVKYWGKRDAALNLPAVGSISVTLRELITTTRVEFVADASVDTVTLNQRSDARTTARISKFLDLLRARAGVSTRAIVTSTNNFPTGAGVASSASGFAALALAGSRALGLNLSSTELSLFARQGSGSAARSIYGGFVEMLHGERSDGQDCVAVPLIDENSWPMHVVVGITSRAAKDIGSTDGMEATRQTSPYYDAWIKGAAADLAIARDAIRGRDFARLAQVSEHSCLKMHALMMSADPGLIYWNGATVAAFQTLRNLRKSGVAVFGTIDAGPQIKAICLPEASAIVSAALKQVSGVEEVLVSALGPGARLVD